jgi:mono/diheme cytochrome c family protein
MPVWIKKHWRLGAILLLIGGITIDFLLFRSGILAGNQPVIINDIAAPPVPTLNAARVAEGERIYAQYCATCHGANLEGQPDWKTPLADGSLPPPPHDNSGHTWHHPDEMLITITLNGGNPESKSKMPAFKDQLTREQIVAVLDFIKSQWGREEREYQWWMTAVGGQQ